MSLDGRGVWGRMDTCVCMAESLCYWPETITILLIGYTPTQNKKGLKNMHWKNLIGIESVIFAPSQDKASQVNHRLGGTQIGQKS